MSRRGACEQGWACARTEHAGKVHRTCTDGAKSDGAISTTPARASHLPRSPTPSRTHTAAAEPAPAPKAAEKEKGGKGKGGKEPAKKAEDEELDALLAELDKPKEQPAAGGCASGLFAGSGFRRASLAVWGLGGCVAGKQGHRRDGERRWEGKGRCTTGQGWMGGTGGCWRVGRVWDGHVGAQHGRAARRCHGPGPRGYCASRYQLSIPLIYMPSRRRQEGR